MLIFYTLQLLYFHPSKGHVNGKTESMKSTKVQTLGAYCMSCSNPVYYSNARARKLATPRAVAVTRGADIKLREIPSQVTSHSSYNYRMAPLQPLSGWSRSLRYSLKRHQLTWHKSVLLGVGNVGCVVVVGEYLYTLMVL